MNDYGFRMFARYVTESVLSRFDALAMRRLFRDQTGEDLNGNLKNRIQKSARSCTKVEMLLRRFPLFFLSPINRKTLSPIAGFLISIISFFDFQAIAFACCFVGAVVVITAHLQAGYPGRYLRPRIWRRRRIC